MSTADAADGADWTTLTTTPSQFEAEVVVAVLLDAGIEAFVISEGNRAWDLSVGVEPQRVVIQVGARDLEHACEVIREHLSESVDLDWDQVDVGERVDDLPLRTPGRMPWIARVAYAVAIVIALISIVGMAVMLTIGS